MRDSVEQLFIIEIHFKIISKKQLTDTLTYDVTPTVTLHEKLVLVES